jgi:DNA-binding LacI/PurR family transcriptional regulator
MLCATPNWRFRVTAVGFDDIQGTAFQNPRLATIPQPRKKIGTIAAQTLLLRITRPEDDSHSREIVEEPELVERESTARVPD